MLSIVCSTPIGSKRAIQWPEGRETQAQPFSSTATARPPLATAITCAKTIRRTFGTLDSPVVTLVTEVDAMDLKVDKRSEGLGDVKVIQEDNSLIKDGIPNP